jgi:hypothetical protein
MRIRALVAAIATAPLLMGAAKPIHLAPSSPWVVDYAENSCRLVRHFGTGRDDTIFALESEAPGAMDMLVVGRPLASGAAEASAQFMPVQGKPMDGMLSQTVDDSVPSVLINNVRMLPPDALAAAEKRDAERKQHPEVRPPAVSLGEQATRKAQRYAFATAATSIQVVTRRDRPVILETGSLGDAIKAFDQCSRDSLKDWGVDPDLEDKIVRPVWTPNASAWFSPDDYPKDMLRTLHESVVKVRLLVDATGRVTKCTSLSHFREPEFNKVTCDKFTERARFEPAELADGTKVPSYYVNKVVFRIGS